MTTVRASVVANLIGCSRPTVTKWTREGRLPAIRLGRQFRYDLTEVRRVLREARYDPEDEADDDTEPNRQKKTHGGSSGPSCVS